MPLDAVEVENMTSASSEGAGSNQDGPGGTPAKTEQDILKKLLYDEGDFLTRLEDTVRRAGRFLGLEKGGRVVLTDDAKRLRIRDQIRVLLAGRYFAWKLGLVATDKMNYREIAVELNKQPYGISPELTALVRDGDLVRDDDGLVAMPFHRIDGTLRELEQSKTFAVAEGEADLEPVRRNGTRRPARQRSDPIVQSMLEKSVDLSEYSWVTSLKKAQDKGLAALLIANEKYGVNEMTCRQMEALLRRKFPVEATQAAIRMAFLNIKSQYIDSASRGKELVYTLLPMGREYILGVASQVRPQGGRDDSDADGMT